MQQRLRVATTVLFNDLVIAGAGTDVGANAGPLSDALPPIMPYRQARTGGDAPGTFRSDVITLVHVPSRSQTTIASDMPARSASVRVNSGFGCPLTDAACGFSGARMALIYRRRRFVRSVSDRRCSGIAARAAPPNHRLRQDLPGRQPDCRGHRADLFPEGRPGGRRLPVDAGRRRRQSCSTCRGPCRPDRFRVLRRSAAAHAAGAARSRPATDVLSAGRELCRHARCARRTRCRGFPCSNPRTPSGLVAARRLATHGWTRGVPTRRPSTVSMPISSGFDGWLSRCGSNRRSPRCAVRQAPLFFRGGTSTGGARFLPDQTIRFQVSPRNLTLARRARADEGASAASRVSR